MAILIELLRLSEIERLSISSNFKYGQAIYKRGAVKLIELEPTKAEAWVGGLKGTVVEGGGSRRRTQLFATSEGLVWHCTGNPKNHQIFCKHCVALALAIQHNP